MLFIRPSSAVQLPAGIVFLRCSRNPERARRQLVMNDGRRLEDTQSSPSRLQVRRMATAAQESRIITSIHYRLSVTALEGLNSSLAIGAAGSHNLAVWYRQAAWRTRPGRRIEAARVVSVSSQADISCSSSMVCQ